jgi:hypothetical protein
MTEAIPSPGAIAQDLGKTLLGSNQAGAAGFIYSIMAAHGADAKVDATSESGPSNIPDGTLTAKQATVRWRGLWYTHTRWFGALPKEVRRAAMVRERERNKSAFKGSTNIDLGSVGLVLPLEFVYDIHFVDQYPVRASIGERRVELTKDRMAAQAKLIEMHKLVGDARRPKELQTELETLQNQVRELDRQLREVDKGIRNSEKVRGAQIDGKVKFMSNFRINVLQGYLGRDQYIPKTVKAAATFKITPRDDLHNPYFEIKFHWSETLVGGFGNTWDDTFQWFPDRGPQGSGKFVERFMTGARRMEDEQGGRPRIEEKAEYELATMPDGKVRPYVPTPDRQKHVVRSADDLASLYAAAQPPRLEEWERLLMRYDVDPKKLSRAGGQRGQGRKPHRDPRTLFYETVGSLTAELEVYWEAYGSGNAAQARSRRQAIMTSYRALEERISEYRKC